MSNLSDIGFPVRSDKDVNDVIMSVINELTPIPCPPHGFYYRFSDESGAELFLQADPAHDIIGFNPAFNGKSRRNVALTGTIERDTSQLDGAFHARSNPVAEGGSDPRDDFPFVFDVPDFRLKEKITLPKTVEIQLSAFASNDFRLFESGMHYLDFEGKGADGRVRSFVSTGLLKANDEQPDDPIPPQAHAVLTGEIKEFGLRENSLSTKKFYWFLTETEGGEIDIVADPKLVSETPKIGGVVYGSFWLSGRIPG